MEVNYHKEERCYEIWLTHAESINQELRTKLTPFYAECKKNKIKVVIFSSGTGNLLDYTAALLKHNLELSVRKEIEIEKRRAKSESVVARR